MGIILNHPAGQESLDLDIPSRWNPFARRGQLTMLRNDLHIATGLLEFANLGDFAANYWNTTPIPVFFQTLMYIGGVIALFMIFFVCIDARRSWRNIRGLQEEREQLEEGQRDQPSCRGQQADSLDCFLQVKVKELSNEWDRLIMVSLLGFSALLVGIGTLMAPFGARRDLFQASNYLTGWVGNAPCAIYGLFNAFFAGFVCRRALHHQRITTAHLKENDAVLGLFKKRANRILFHGILNGITALGAGAAAMCTATHFWAYCGLLPICFLSFYFNWFWRHKLGYSRPLYQEVVDFDEIELLDKIGVTHTLREQVRSSELPFRTAMEYILVQGAFEEFCLKLLEDEDLYRALVPQEDKKTVRFDPQNLLSRVEDRTTSVYVRKKIAELARQSLHETSRYRDRWLLELLGCQFSILNSSRDIDDIEKQLDGRWAAL